MKALLGALWFGFSTCGLSALTLPAAMDTTLRKNSQIQTARAGLEKAAGNRLVFRAISFPDARLIAVLGVQGGKRTEESSSTQPFGFVHGDFAQPLFNAAIPASRRRGDLEILVAEQQLNVAVVEQLHQARIAFYSALYHRSLESLRRSQAQQLQENLHTQQARFDAGLTDRGTVTAATVQARELDPQIEGATRSYQGALIVLAQTMGNPLGPSASLPSPEGELRFETTHFVLLDEIAHALAQRSDLKLARLLVRTANEDQRIVQADYYPSLKAVVSGEYIPVSGVRRGGEDSPHRSDDFISSEIRAGAAYTWRVIDNGKVGGAVLRQREISAANNLLLEQLEANVPRELARLQNDFTLIEARENAFRETEALAQENVRVMRETLAQGLVSQLELRDAENSLLAAREGRLTAAYQANVARAERDRVTGRYFQFSHDTAANVH